MSDRLHIAPFVALAAMLFLIVSLYNPAFSSLAPLSQQTTLVDDVEDTGIHGADADITQVSFDKNGQMLGVAITVSGGFNREYSFFVEFYLSPDAQPTRLSMGHGNRTLLLVLESSRNQYQASLIISPKQTYFPLECRISEHNAFIRGIPASLLNEQNRFWVTAFSQIDYSFWLSSQNSSTPLSMHLLWKAFDVAPNEGLFEVILPKQTLKLDSIQIQGEISVGEPLTLLVNLANENDAPAKNVKLTVESNSENISILEYPPEQDIAPHQKTSFLLKMVGKTAGLHSIVMKVIVDGWEADVMNEQKTGWPIILIEIKSRTVSATFNPWILGAGIGFVLIFIIVARTKFFKKPMPLNQH